MVEHVGVTDELIGIRHYLHQHPERSFKEVETSAYLARLLRGHGIDVLDTTLETGVVALIEGEVPGPRIALRADIDGLPITEDTGLPFSSLNPGVMHGCGHDLHMTGLLGAAFWLADHRDRIAGSVKIVFQPAEEVGLGARTVVESGATDDVKAIIGTHNNPNYAPGQIAIGPQPMMAGCVKFKVTLHAQGTHAGYPQKGTGPN
ncbi:M20 family metallopeptidase, partial [Bifidobacterium bifidum]|uniref:M20 metallopeptidase family protein n=1 Tax=Bifidobacterium bifidum TaxID=1681 RepID=UPI003B99713C